MNAVADAAVYNGAYGSDSDASSDDSPEYYQPISNVEIGDDDEEGEGEAEDLSNGDLNPNFHHQLLPNGWMENGLSPLDLRSDDNEAEEEAAAEAIESEMAIERAFREDEMRRAAPLPAEAAVRVMEAMRGVSFSGGAPDWARQVPEGEWRDRLRRLRTEPSAAVDN
ncbi:uncharacterized protein LOC127259954 [Andrographis paniculata]|uniref:uncharacterized protein LOC127259954 n=1 Tax=Andrographis paniculata TaxID=175694 RepID=UPI0021E7ECC5|nr:uncharacterized protein LOC127259954 [Andrographis paniculata]